MENKTRVFQLETVSKDGNGEEFFYPKYDGVYIDDQHIDSNGFSTSSCNMNEMRKASYKEAKNYIWDIYQNKETNLKLYDNNRKLKRLFRDMKSAFQTNVIFQRELNELGDFEDNGIYTDDSRTLLNLLRAYYKCRIINGG